MDVIFKQLQDVTPAQIATAAARLLGSAPSAEGLYIPCNQWSAADAAPLIEKSAPCRWSPARMPITGRPSAFSAFMIASTDTAG